MDRLGITGQDYDNGNNDQLLTANATPSSNIFSYAWGSLYEGISRANDAITNIPLKSPYDTATKAKYVAEAKFLRAYFYFRLAELFQNVPIYLQPTVYNQFTKPASSRDSVWMQVIQDLTDAINTSALPNYYAQSSPNAGRVTKGAAYALRGEVYMWQQKWSQAIADFQAVQSMSFYSLYTGSGDSSYKMLFKAAQNNCPEMIFEQQNIDAPNNAGGSTEFYCGTRSSYGSCWDWYSPSNILINLYENQDGSQFNWDNVIPGYNEMTPAQREVFFIRNGATSAELSAAQARGAQVSLYDPVNNQARIQAAFANRDRRLQYTVITPYSNYLGNPINNVPTTYTWTWPYRGGTDIQSDKITLGMYFYRKFVYESIEGSNRQQVPINYPVIRYADVLLQWAEALNESQGPSQQALDLINPIRNRAGLPPLTLAGTGPNVVAGQADLKERIRNERRVEFALEGVDYFDELRWGTWLQLKMSSTNSAQTPWGTTLAPYTLQGSYITTWPIPASVIQINSNLAKTPGWTY